MTVRCPTCGGSGEVQKVLPEGTYGFGKWPTETCRTCSGSGWAEKQQDQPSRAASGKQK